jgi:hypothetical protein
MDIILIMDIDSLCLTVSSIRAIEVCGTQGTTGSPVVTTTAWVDDTGIPIIGNTAAENCRALEKIHDRAAD